MSINNIRRLHQTQSAANIDKEKEAKGDVQDALKRNLEHVDSAYSKNLAEIAKNKEAREEKSDWTCAFAIILGPFVGTAIGSAIGGAANDSEEEAARELKKEAGSDDLKAQKAMDDFGDARLALEDTKSQGQQIDKFGSELRDAAWTGI